MTQYKGYEMSKSPVVQFVQSSKVGIFYRHLVEEYGVYPVAFVTVCLPLPLLMFLYLMIQIY